MAQLDFFGSSPRPWNTGMIIGPKPPFKPKHVWAIRQQLKTTGRVRDLALFNCGIDAKLRGCDLVKLRVSDVDAFIDRNREALNDSIRRSREEFARGDYCKLSFAEILDGCRARHDANN